MPFFSDVKETGVSDLIEPLRDHFKNSDHVIRSRHYDRDNGFTEILIKNQHTKNSIIILEKKGVVGATVKFFERLPNEARYIGRPYLQLGDGIPVSPNMNKHLLIETMIAHLQNESPFSRVPFRKIKATKKRLEDLNEDEVFGARVVEVRTIPKVDGVYFELSFENESGTYMAKAQDIERFSANLIGKYMAFNKDIQLAFYTSYQFREYFEIIETDSDISRPADLFPN